MFLAAAQPAVERPGNPTESAQDDAELLEVIGGDRVKEKSLDATDVFCPKGGTQRLVEGIYALDVPQHAEQGSDLILLQDYRPIA